MVEQSGSGRVGVRFGIYIDELREFFTSRRIGFGSPKDLVGFADSIGVPGAFQDEMGSLVRSIHFREADRLGRGEMLELVSVAVGGPEVEGAAQEMHASVRQIFVFVNEALRQRQWAFPGEIAEMGEQEVTAGQILNTSPMQGNAEERAVSGRIPENGFPSGTETPRREAEAREAGRSVPESSGMLFKAVSMAEDELPHSREDASEVPVSRRPWVVPAAVAAVVALAAAVFLGDTANKRPAGSAAVAGTAASPTQPGPVAGGSCVASSAAGSSRAGLQDRSRWAQRLLDQKMYDVALPELRQIAQADPGYPGIYLQVSDALLQLKRPEDARDAVDTQIGISACLAKLPSAALDAYCSAEFPPSTVGGCRTQLSHIRQAAELQAALVHLELGHREAPEAGAQDPGYAEAAGPAAPAPTAGEAPRLRVRRAVPLPPATEGDNEEPAPARGVGPARPGASGKPSRKNSGEDMLKRGDGTDSAYGAYSKPQE